ncbi:MAG: phosphoribosylglycinamide formyltransferase [Gammaproteobacteria bacterium]|jgi:phosphoribosylglycinamide formyltransferase-1|nr:phosphoribosylglycinamide formyltransferase [Gammaproteobacteria bacterium]
MNAGGQRRLVVLLSGRGSNFAALQRAAESGWLGATIAGVISDRPRARGLALAGDYGIDAVSVDRAAHIDRDAFEASLRAAVEGFRPAYIVLAGFMRVLSDGFVRRYAGRMINIHPSLLPRHPGLNTHQRVLDAGQSEHGASVHVVTPDLDRGPVISRVRIAVRPDDTATTLAERLLPLEHRLLPATMALLLRSRVEAADDQIRIDGHELDRPFELGVDLDRRGAGKNRRSRD